MAAVNGRAMKAKGSAFERDVVAFLRDHGHPFAERHYGAGRPEDVGDIDGIPGWTQRTAVSRHAVLRSAALNVGERSSAPRGCARRGVGLARGGPRTLQATFSADVEPIHPYRG